MRFILKFFIFALVVFAVLSTLFIFVDSKQNGFFTLTKSQKIFTTQKKNTITIVFTATDANLGTVALQLIGLKKGFVNFQMKEKGAKAWLYQSSYYTEAFNQLSPYPFGFAVIPDSYNKEYVISISPKDSGVAKLQSSSFQTKYAYSRNEITANKKILVEFILKKYVSVFFSTYIWLYALIIALLLIQPKRLLSFLAWGIKRLTTIAYFVPIVLFALLSYFMLVHNQSIAEKIVSYFWVFTAFALLTLAFKKIHNFLITKNEDYLKKKVVTSFILISIIAVILGALQKTYLLGGDDSRIFFLYPIDYFINFASKIGPDTAVSSLVSLLPPVTIAPFIIFLIVLKQIFFAINLQIFLFVLNIIGGLWFFYLLLDYIISEKSFESFIAKCLASLFYVFSIFNFYTLFNSQLIAMFLISIFPYSLYLYIRGIKEEKIYLLALSALLWSLFSALLVALPWFSAAFLGFLPLLVWLFWKQKKQFVLYNLFFLLFILVLNAYWIYASAYSSISTSSTSQNQVISSQDYRAENAKGIQATSEINKVFFPLLNLYHYDIQNNFHWPYLPIFTLWYLMLLPFNALFILVICYTGIRMQKSSMRSLYVASIFSFLTSVYFFTVNIGNQGINIFLFLSNHIPGFVMYRNMYDKFGFAIAVSFAIMLGVCLAYLFKEEKNTVLKKGIFIAVLLLTLLNAKPFLFNEFYSIPIWTTNNSYNAITGFNKDYLDMAQYIKQNDNASRYLWLPLNKGNISQIEDKTIPNHYYNGVSPLLFLSGKNDYSGITSFEGYSDEISRLLYERKYKELGVLYKQFNARYIIVNHTVTSDIKQSYICDQKLCSIQDKKYERAILGKKIKDFGSRYSLYEIKPQYLSDKIMIQNSSGSVAYKKLSSDEYDIQLTHVTKNVKLLFLDPYFPNWELVTNTKKPLNGTNHTKAYNYSNVWNLNFDQMQSSLPTSEYQQNNDGTVNVSFKLFFKKSLLYPRMIAISSIAYIAIFGVGIFKLGLLIARKINK